MNASGANLETGTFNNNEAKESGIIITSGLRNFDLLSSQKAMDFDVAEFSRQIQNSYEIIDDSASRASRIASEDTKDDPQPAPSGTDAS